MPLKHQDIGMPVWVPRCEKLESEFLPRSEAVLVTTTDAGIHFISREPRLVLPPMQRHNSVDVLICEGADVTTEIRFDKTRISYPTHGISLKNVLLSVESFAYIMEHYAYVDLDRVSVSDDNFDFETEITCHAEKVHMPASLLYYVDSFTSCRELKIYVDTLYFEPRTEPFDTVNAYGIVDSAEGYSYTCKTVWTGFPNVRRDNVSIDLEFETLIRQGWVMNKYHKHLCCKK